ncbi:MULTISPECIES: hypothetical protein [Nostocales]|uniref:Uncharacterized protein n=3 Tax=Nostocales TaxID=1161 RepID=A0A0C1QV87_9CYAN|nr:hypothetical protein [Tolypothrix bouteillei]KAF3888794.1 hypothetical protein DA73_0400027395 [Tolypothrix bouteillei VB521301]
MGWLQQSRRILVASVLILILTITTACSGGAVAQVNRTNHQPTVSRDLAYGELERGNTAGGESFGNWVVQASKGLISDAYVRDNNKLGVVISSQVPPNEVRSLAKSLVEGFHRNFPKQDLTVLVFAPDKQRILTVQYDVQTNQIQYS